MGKSLTSRVILFCLVICLPDATAFAYLDPSSGSMLTQLVLGGLAGLLVLIQVFWRKIKTTLSSCMQRVFRR